jgi:hypothetical protein
MVVIAISILLVILIVANVGVSVFNAVYPPCDDLNEYFSSARRLPDGAASGLRTVQSGTDGHYIGAKTVSTGKPGVIGLRSRNFDIEESLHAHSNAELLKAVGNALGDNKPNKQENTETKKKRTKGNKSAIFEEEMEGLLAGNSHRNTNEKTTKPSGFIKGIERDGYSDRKVNEW